MECILFIIFEIELHHAFIFSHVCCGLCSHIASLNSYNKAYIFFSDAFIQRDLQCI